MCACLCLRSQPTFGSFKDEIGVFSGPSEVSTSGDLELVLLICFEVGEQVGQHRGMFIVVLVFDRPGVNWLNIGAVHFNLFRYSNFFF